MRERIKKLDELIPATEYFFSGDLDYTPVLPRWPCPRSRRADVGKALLDYVERFEARDGFDKEMLEEVARAVDRGARLEDQARVHAAAPRRHRPQGVAAAVRHDGGARQGDHAPPAAPTRPQVLGKAK